MQAKLNIRPFAVEFLAKMSNLFEIVIFTASEKIYADTIIDHIDPQSTTKFIWVSLILQESWYLTDFIARVVQLFKDSSHLSQHTETSK